MGKISLLDCTLRDGGYVNNWDFGKDTITGFGKKIAKTGIEFYEIGFLKGDSYDENKSVFSCINDVNNVIAPKSDSLVYLGMLDMSAPLPYDRITPRTSETIDGIRLIFKKDKIDEAYEYSKYILKQGYMLFVNLVGTDSYSDSEFIDTINKFNSLNPYGLAIVDSFGMIKRKQFLRLVYLADNNLNDDIALCYHAHNNLQQAFGNAESLVELNLKRDIVIDACVFGMGRGAGNLNLELFAEYMNENYDTEYKIEPMLEIMDEYLNDIYKDRFWGYSLPLYLSANNGCHPNYAIYLAEKGTLTVKAFNGLLKSIPECDKARFSKENAEKYYREYLEVYYDDSETSRKLSDEFRGKNILILAPGASTKTHESEIKEYITNNDSLVIATNFLAKNYNPDYIFSGNMRRYLAVQGNTTAKCITTSNMHDCEKTDYILNFASYASKEFEIVDNSVLMMLRFLSSIGIKEVSIAGMDGYEKMQSNNYCDERLEYNFSNDLVKRNMLIEEELKEINKKICIRFVTPTGYRL